MLDIMVSQVNGPFLYQVGGNLTVFFFVFHFSNLIPVRPQTNLDVAWVALLLSEFEEFLHGHDSLLFFASVPLSRIIFPIHNRQKICTTLAFLGPLRKLKIDARGWTLDVLNVVRALNKNEFTLEDVYSFAGHLAKLHPANRHVRDKIRQQLQVLRDLGWVEFLGGGRYRCV
jgi:hypothetical protein